MTCNCGVAIREHNDVIVLDTCTQDLVMRNGMPMKIRIPSGRKLRKGTYILGRHPSGYSEYEVSTCSQVHQMHNFIKHYMKVFPHGIYPRVGSIGNQTSDRNEGIRFLM